MVENNKNADCIFCKIVNKEIEAPLFYEDDELMAMPDKFPQAETHILIMPKKHVHSIAQSEESDAPMIGRLVFLAKKIADQKGIADYKLIFNNGKHAQIPHLHLHLIAGSDVRPLPV